MDMNSKAIAITVHNHMLIELGEMVKIILDHNI